VKIEDLQKPMSLKRHLPIHVLSGNTFTNKFNRWKYPNYRDSWHKDLTACCPKPDPHKWDKERKLYGAIVRVMEPGKKYFDEPNYSHGCKPIPDWLKIWGWIKDDSPKWWKCDYEQFTALQAKDYDLIPGTIICIFKGEG